MKKITSLLCFAFVLLWTSAAFSQAQQQRIVRIRDNTTNNMADVIQLQLTFPNTNWGLQTAAGNYVWNGANWLVMGADVNGDLTVNQTTTVPGYGRLQDGDSTVLVDVTDAGTFGLSNSLNGIVGDTRLYGWNGASWDPALLGATGELQITDVATRPGENPAANRRDVGKVYSAPVTPPIQGPTAVAGVAVNVFTAREIIGDPNWCLWYTNAGGGGGGALTDADVQVSYDGVSWESLTWAPCDTLAATATCSYCVSGSAYRYMRGYATAAAGPNDTTVEAAYTANKN